MKDIYDLLKELKNLGARIYVVDGKIKLDIKREDLTKDISDKIKFLKEDLIAFLSETKTSNFGAIEQVATQEDYAMSDAQRRLWIMCQFEESANAYNIPGNFYLDSNVDINCFKRAVESLVDRHESLRTVFRENESTEIRQCILSREELGFEVECIDLRNEENKQQIIQAFLTKDASKRFDLENGPLFTAALLQIEENDFVYCYNIHHIISDGWSMNVYFSDLYLFYEAYQKKKRPELDKLKIQYKDYSAWQINQLESGSFNTQRNFWFKNLGGNLPKLDLPSSKPRPRIKTYSGENVKNSFISASVTKKLKTFSEENGGSLFMGLTAAWNLLLYRYTGQTDVIIGTPISGREHVDLKVQIGFYVNTLAIRNTIKPEDTFNTLFKRVKENMMQSYSNQMYPFNRLVEELNSERDISRSPIFDIMLVYNGSNNDTESGEVEKEVVETKKQELEGISDFDYNPTKFDLEVGFKELEGDYLSIWGTYNPDVYEDDMINQLIKHFKQIVKGVLANPDVNVTELDYLSKSEKAQQLIDFNTTEIDYPKDKTIGELFAAQAQMTPNKVALVFEDKTLTYKELDEQSNQLAHYLKENYKIQPDDLVAIRQERSEWMLISILGVLKSGGAYVPIDPEYPSERIAYIESDAKCKVCLDQNELNKFKSAQNTFPKEQATIVTNENNLAYVIYTSGSTGKPKGVMVEHKAIVNTIHAQIEAFGINDATNGLEFASFSFDASISESFIILMAGGRLSIIGEQARKDPKGLIRFINEQEIDIATLPPSYLAQIDFNQIKGLKKLITAGEAANYEKAAEYSNFGTYYNAYGPTETSICGTIYKWDKSAEKGRTNVPIGTPISNVQTYILNQAEQLQPTGAIGEICIAGSGLARGYLNLAELTKEKFVANPFNEGERLYKTGDLGRYLPDGNIEYIGRKDDQVKLRGYRIELGEIEQVLTSYSAIESTVVLTIDNNTEKELVAYFTVKDGLSESDDSLNLTDLRKYLKQILPAYMIPAYFVPLEELPLTVNGKIDKKALPNPEGVGIVSGVEYIAPRNQIEEKLIEIWQEILQRENIGIKDDFFESGGHSLKAIRLSNEYQKEFEIKLSINDLFLHTTPASHAELIQTLDKTEFIQIPVVEENAIQGYAISDAQRRLWVLSQFDQGSVAYNMHLSVTLNGAYNIENFKKAIDATIQRHDILRTVFVEDKTVQSNGEKSESWGEIRQRVLDMDELNFEISLKDFRDEPNGQELANAYINEDAYKPFDLENGPLLRAAFIRLEDKSYVFYYNMHHIISDGWSLEVLAKDVFAYYEGYEFKTEPQLNALRIQYKDYSAWQLAQLKEEIFKQHKSFWLEQLSGELPLLNLPTSKQRPRLKTNNGHSLGTFIDADLTLKLKSHSQENGGSLFMGLLATWNVLFYRYTSQNDIVIGTPIAGREHADLRDQIGFYINTLALRNKLDPQASFNTLYQSVKENTLTSYSHQAYPFDRLVDDLNLQRDTSRSAVFDVMLSLQNIEENRSEFDPSENGLTQDEINQIVDHGASVSKFDISIYMEEMGDYLSLKVVYNPDVYEREMAEGLIKHFKYLLSQILVNPEEKLAEIDYLSLPEKSEILAISNPEEVDYPKEKTVVDLFSAQVEIAPNKLALVFEDKTLTYAELNECSNQLAHYLLENYKVNLNDLVSIKLERSEWMIVAILAVLKAGGAYVPIDHEYPESRIAFIEEDANCVVCIDESELEKFRSNQTVYSTEATCVAIMPANLAYLIYTSGSTGTPKGVMIEQRSLVNYIYQQSNYFKVADDDRFVLFSNPSFDASVEQIFLPLTNGAQLFIPTRETILDTEMFLGYCNQNGITHLHAVPSYLNKLNLEGEIPFKRVVSAGETFNQNVWELLKGRANVYNKYGPTESTISASIYQLDTTTNNEGSIPIGKSIANTSLFILDELGNLQPFGVTGEICIAGEGLARGYLNQKQTTTEKFVSSSTLGQERIYKTGDLGRWLPDGNMEFVGRKDDQVKIRGYRIELGEIEHALLMHDAIDAVVILAPQNAEGDKDLVAYLTSKVEQDLTSLRTYLKEILPEYMLPTYFVQLDEFPLTSNAKVDKKALPSPDGIGLSSGAAYVTPRNETEERMVDIWEEVLQRDGIGIMDDFFTLGGHSITAMKVMLKIQDEFGVKLDLVELFNDPTIANLSGYIDSVSLIGKQTILTDNDEGELLF
ncbi:MAG: amino acid adenylation domain-containing protein [Crocinitomix sp.]|jgi:amino acid adenylation domain-containing protein